MSGRVPHEYDTPIGIFVGLEAAAKANNISVSTLQKRLKDTPETFYDMTIEMSEWELRKSTFA